VVFKISLIPTGFMGEMPAIGPEVETSGYNIGRPNGTGFWVKHVSVLVIYGRSEEKLSLCPEVETSGYNIGRPDGTGFWVTCVSLLVIYGQSEERHKLRSDANAYRHDRCNSPVIYCWD
jgi:hypothetical protein